VLGSTILGGGDGSVLPDSVCGAVREASFVTPVAEFVAESGRGEGLSPFGDEICQVATGRGVEYPTVSLADARQARDEAKQLLLKGVDPLQAKKEKQDERPANTFRILAEDGPTRPFRRPNGFSTSPIRSWVTMRSTKLILPWCSRSFAKSKLADAMKRPVADDRP
jgi:hypothetical protein